MADYLKFWFAKFIVEHGIELLFITICLGIIAVLSAQKWLRQARCKHGGRLYETQACEAICQQCGKNLGFIGALKRTESGDDK
ncbi:hypothetical protein DFLDMN_001533 [Cupriavidus sp. H19C3]|uniref:hypothetical protein n=1 Tax=Cupriavidus sp. H19C3 TaxID=3241603 RepID=UPI003BF8F984